MLKLADNPAVLTPHVQSVTELGGTWWAAYTKARFEKAFARDLLGHGIGYFLPMYQKTVFSGGRKRHVMAPLFPSYVFFCGTELDRYTALTTNRICHTVSIRDQQRFIAELVNIEKALLGKAVVDGYPQLAVGRRCRIRSGPMMNTEGVLIQKDCAKARIVLEVTILAQGALVEVDADLVELVE